MKVSDLVGMLGLPDAYLTNEGTNLSPGRSPYHDQVNVFIKRKNKTLWSSTFFSDYSGRYSMWVNLDIFNKALDNYPENYKELVVPEKLLQLKINKIESVCVLNDTEDSTSSGNLYRSKICSWLISVI